MNEEVDILTRPEREKIVLLDGKEYILPANNMTTISHIQKSMGFKITDIKDRIEEDAVETSLTVGHAILKETYPELTRDEAGLLFNAALLGRMIGKVFGVSIGD